MKIVFLDSDTFGKNANFEIFNKFGIVTLYNNTSAEQTNLRINKAHIIVTNKVKIGLSNLNQAPDLKLICVAATGYNNIDLEACNRFNIPVVNVKGYSTQSVVQLVFAYIFAHSTSLINYNQEVKNGNWHKSDIFTMRNHPFSELNTKTLGIIGFGNIGKKIKETAAFLGLKVLVAGRKNELNIPEDRTTFNTVLSESDYITIHTPLTPETRNLITTTELEMMKKNAFIINTARGGIINHDHLYNALVNNTISGAAIDVWDTEPPQNEHPLFTLPSAIFTPHIAWASEQSIIRLLEGIVSNIDCYLNGQINEIKIK